MGDNAVSCRAAGSRRGKAPHAVAAAAVAAVIVLIGDGLQHGDLWRVGPGQGACGHCAEAGRE